jgi:ABC-type dipeptide/oligopeptide/nickel transport system permease component
MRLLAERFALLLLVALAASFGLFAAVRALPGDPVALRLKAPNPERVAEERERLGLDLPWPAQYGRYLANFATGDWGASLATGRSVRRDFAEFFPATLELSLAALLIGALAGAGAALAADRLRYAWLRRLAFFLGTMGLTVPIFWVGMLALVAGSLWLGWFPSGGRFDLAMVPPRAVTGFLVVDCLLAGEWAKAGDALHHLALPALCLSLFPASQVCAVLQARLQDPRLRSMVTALRARGFGPARIWGKHALRAISAPAVAALGTSFGGLLGGAALTETVFSWPGLGRYLVTATLDRDLYVIQNALLLVILLAVAVAFFSDAVARRLNPAAFGGER